MALRYDCFENTAFSHNFKEAFFLSGHLTRQNKLKRPCSVRAFGIYTTVTDLHVWSEAMSVPGCSAIRLKPQSTSGPRFHIG